MNLKTFLKNVKLQLLKCQDVLVFSSQTEYLQVLDCCLDDRQLMISTRTLEECDVHFPYLFNKIQVRKCVIVSC